MVRFAQSGGKRLRAAVPTSAVVYALAAAATAALWPSVTGLVQFWLHTGDYHQGFLVALVATCWLLATRRTLNVTPASASWPALLTLPVALALWFVGWRAGINISGQMLWPAIVLLAVWAACGRTVARAILVPVAYLYFAIPLWDALIPLLQWLTVGAVKVALGALGVPVAVDGSLVTIPEGQFDIIEDCSGKRFLITALAIGVLAGALRGLRGGRFWALLGACAMLAIIMNWLRVAAVVETGHLTNMRGYLVAVEHVSFGWLLFALVVAAIVWFALRLSGQDPSQPAAVVPQVAVAPRVLIVATVLLMLVVVPALNARARPLPQRLPPLGPFPALGGGSVQAGPGDAAWAPQFAGAAREGRASYALADGRVEAYVNLFGVQSAGHKVAQPDHSVLGPGWESPGGIGVGNWLAAAVGASPRLVVATDAIGAEWIIAYRYRVGPFATGNASLAQVLYGAQAVVVDVPEGVAALAMMCAGDCPRAVRSLQGIAARELNALDGMIPRCFDGSQPGNGRTRILAACRAVGADGISANAMEKRYP